MNSFQLSFIFLEDVLLFFSLKSKTRYIISEYFPWNQKNQWVHDKRYKHYQRSENQRCTNAIGSPPERFYNNHNLGDQTHHYQDKMYEHTLCKWQNCFVLKNPGIGVSGWNRDFTYNHEHSLGCWVIWRGRVRCHTSV